MTTDLSDTKIFVGLVSFEKGADILGILSSEDIGAVSWMGGRAQSEKQFVELARLELAEIGLHLVEVENTKEIDQFAEVYELDEHLAHNMKCWEAGKMTVWGTLYPYLAEGEA